jgi:hypothetical protein
MQQQLSALQALLVDDSGDAWPHSQALVAGVDVAARVGLAARARRAWTPTTKQRSCPPACRDSAAPTDGLASMAHPDRTVNRDGSPYRSSSVVRFTLKISLVALRQIRILLLALSGTALARPLAAQQPDSSRRSRSANDTVGRSAAPARLAALEIRSSIAPATGTTVSSGMPGHITEEIYAFRLKSELPYPSSTRRASRA